MDMDGPNRVGIELEDIAEAMSQLANIGSELLRPEDDRDPLWRSIPVAKEIMVTKGIASRAPWEAIQVFIDPFMYQIHYICWLEVTKAPYFTFMFFDQLLCPL